jgi:hypothetical protein
VPEEITSICADFLVELRGFEPPTSAVQAPARAAGSRLRPALLQKPGGGQSFGSSPLVAEAKFLPDPGEVVAAYRIVPPLLCGMVLQHLQPADHLLPTFPCLRRLARRLVA